jgi:hypothetical protein
VFGWSAVVCTLVSATTLFYGVWDDFRWASYPWDHFGFTILSIGNAVISILLMALPFAVLGLSCLWLKKTVTRVLTLGLMAATVGLWLWAWCVFLINNPERGEFDGLLYLVFPVVVSIVALVPMAVLQEIDRSLSRSDA